MNNPKAVGTRVEFCTQSGGHPGWRYGTILGGPNIVIYPLGNGVTQASALFTVREESSQLTYVVPHSNLREAEILLPMTAMCPECEEEDFFLEEDYVCGYCRTNVIDP